ncbi:hypothetical protein BU16DRAFT_620741 [Lophium mytilinum]|uniref:Uncharacterized protein n=1 Tax=Lophium mytilinum TaxID=390894 RepID=A0A6A6QJG2_9PEZI|nr:hypothetical protein BU16DRAFT_620741 [Lophium mytilinum]
MKRTASGDINCSPWKPFALRAPILACAVLISWALIIVLQLLLAKSQRDSGIIFAANTSELPLSCSFLYLYFPTVIAVVYSLFWSWIDLETKRLEPYYQLSKSEGAFGKDSLMLHYPFDFIPFVPIRAMRNRHWPVFWASTVMVMITWGLVPIQAGIFATSTVTKSSEVPMLVPTGPLSLDQQKEIVTTQYMQSVFGITWLNETLPPYMSRLLTLAPFKTQSQPAYGYQETWSAKTTSYGLDLFCQEGKRKMINETEYYTSSNGCRFPTNLGLTGNNTIGGNAVLEVKEFSTFYVGYWNYIGEADYYLSDGSCPVEANHTFYAAFTRNKRLASDPPEQLTTIFCEPKYYSQEVEAMVTVPLQHPVKANPIGPKSPISPAIYNTSVLESRMNSAGEEALVRGDMPSRTWPSQIERISSMNLSQSIGGADLPFMAAFMIGASDHSLEEYLDPQILGRAYESAYRLIFARAMVDVLNTSWATTAGTIGTREYKTGAVILVPAFTYVVEGLLGVVSVFAIALLYLSFTRPRQLRSDPGTITAVMSLVADDTSLLSDFGHFDCCTIEDINTAIGKRKYCLEYDGKQSLIRQLDDTTPNGTATKSATSISPTRGISKPVRPIEFSLPAIVPFITFQVCLAVTLALLYQRSQPYGLALPSKNRIVRQTLQNYIPTAIATIIEPIWIVVNRLLCMLQPLEELRNGKATAKKSIALDYSSLPPQLVIWKAIRSCHFILAAVCAMALLANVLAIAFSGLFNENEVEVSYSTSLHQHFSDKFVSINGSVGPQNIFYANLDSDNAAYQGGKGMDQFYISVSNTTTGTDLPPWTDQKFMYVPFEVGEVTTSTEYLVATTRAFGAELDCTEVAFSADNSSTGTIWTDPRLKLATGTAYFSITVKDGNGNSTTCFRAGQDIWNAFGTGVQTANGDEDPCPKDPTALEAVLSVQALPNATQQQQSLCAQTALVGWARNPGPDSCTNNSTKPFDQTNSMFMACRPKILTGLAKVRVDNEGHIQDTTFAEDAALTPPSKELQNFFTNDPKNLIEQAHNYLFQLNGGVMGLAWHTDTFPTDFFNFEIKHAINSSRFLDPSLPLPSFRDASGSFSKVYSRLFAIWLGANQEKLLLPETRNSTLPGSRIDKEIRIFVSIPMFIISEVIIAIYILVSIFVYLRRPGKYLARLPTSIGSIIALFAPSSAVRDLRGTAHMSNQKRAQYLDQLDQRYGYGTRAPPKKIGSAPSIDEEQFKGDVAGTGRETTAKVAPSIMVVKAAFPVDEDDGKGFQSATIA